MKGFYKFILVFLVAFTLIGCEGIDIPSDLLTGDITTVELTIEPTTSDLPTSEITTQTPTTDLITEVPTTAMPLDMKLRSIYDMAVESQSFEGTYEEWLETVRGPDGLPGEDGREIIIHVEGTVLQWQYTGETAWTDLFDLSLLTGLTIAQMEINDLGELVITYSDLSQVNLGPIISYYLVIFRDYNHYIIDIQMVGHGESAMRPDDPVRQGYTFTDWDQDFSAVNDNLEIYALYDVNAYEVSFVTHTETSIDPIMVDHGQSFVLPIPEKENYEFMGWFLGDDVSDRQFFNDSIVDETLNLYARWKPIVYDIIFLDHNGQVFHVLKATIEDTIMVPEAPHLEGYVFIGWDNDLSTLEEAMVLCPIYQATHSLTIFVDGEEVAYMDDYLEGDTIDLSVYEDPGLYNYVNSAFIGWFLDPNFDMPLDTFVFPNQDLELYGQFSHYPEIYLINLMDQILIDSVFDPLSVVEAYDMEDGDITNSIYADGYIDTSIEGTYIITYKVTDSTGLMTELERTFKVVHTPATYPVGVYNYEYASPELRSDFLAAAEAWLLNTQSGGLPVYSQANAFLLTTRVTPALDNFIPLIGYGLDYGQMTEDDSSVLMFDGLAGQAGEFTFRDSLVANPNTFNHWESLSKEYEALVGRYQDALYTYEINSNSNGFVLNPSMALDDPVAIDPMDNGYGQEFAYTWEITLKDNLLWTYHPDTDISALSEGHQILDANDMVETLNRALAESWPGTGLLIENDVDSVVLIDDLTFQISFMDAYNQWQVKQLFSSSILSPIHIELYDLLGETYGTSPMTTAYHGPYYLDVYQEDGYITLKESPNFHDQGKYHYTGYTYVIEADPEVVFQMFLAGELDYATIPNSQKEAYKDDGRRFLEPVGSTFKININGLGSVQNQQMIFPDSTWVPKPILANQDFKTAMYFAIDRAYITDNIVHHALAQMYMFSDNHLLDAYTGIPYRFSPDAMAVGEELSPETFGYDLDVAKAYFDLAIEDMVNDGIYQAGSVDNYNTIEISLYVMANSDEQLAFGQFIKDSFEGIFISDEHYIKVIINVETKDFPAIYHDYLMTGEFDLSVGSLSSDPFDLADFLHVYASDNRSDYTFNWGIETSLPEILVEYQNDQGEHLSEYWSYNAISSVLNGETNIMYGMEYFEPLDIHDEYYITGQFANWQDAMGNSQYLMTETDASDEKLSALADSLYSATEIYSIDVYLSEEDPGWTETYMINDELTYFTGNHAFKFISMTSTNGDLSLNWWGPSIESGEIYNLTPETYYMPQYISEFDENYDPDLYLGHANTNPVVFETGYYTMVLAIIDGNYWLGAIKQDQEVSTNLLDNGDFSQGTNSWTFDAGIIDGGVGTYEVIDEEMVVHVEHPTRSGWGPRIYSSDILFEEDKTYQISFDAKADAERWIRVIIGQTTDDPMIMTYFTPELFVFDLGTEWKSYSFTFKMNNWTDPGKLTFLHGTFMDEAITGHVYYDNIEVKEIEAGPDHLPPMIYGLRDYTINLNDDFDPLANILVYDAFDGMIDNNEVQITSDLDTSIPGMYMIVYQVWDQAGNLGHYSILVDVVEYVFVETDEIVDGSFDTTTAIVPEIQDPDAGNADITPEGIWYYYLADWDGSSATFDVLGQAAIIDITASGTHNWSVMLKQKGISLVEGQTYKLTFTASATATRSIDVMISENHSMKFYLDENTQTYEFTFTYAGPTTDTERIQFLMGMNEIVNNAIITIDDVLLSELDLSSPSEPLWHTNGVMTLNNGDTGLEISYSDTLSNWWLDNAYTIFTDMDENVTKLSLSFSGVQDHEYVFKVEGKGLSTEVSVLATGSSQEVVIDLTGFTIEERLNLQLLVVFVKTLGASGTVIIEDWHLERALDFFTIQDALNYGEDTYMTIYGITAIEANQDIALFTDGEDIIEVYLPNKEIMLGQVYDVTGYLYYYYLTPEIIANEYYAMDIQESDAPVSQAPVTEITGVDDIIAITPLPTQEAPHVFIKYRLTAAVYVNTEWERHSVYLVPTDYDFSEPLAEGALIPNGTSILIYYLSDEEVLSTLHGQIITLDIIMQGFRSDRQVFYASFFGTMDDITIQTLE